MNFSYKRLAVALSVVVAVLVGGKMYVDHVDHVEQVALEKEVQVFAAKVGRSPRPDGVITSTRRSRIEEAQVSDLHVAAHLNLPVLTMSLIKGGADVHARIRRSVDNFERGMTPLHAAVREDASEVAAVLLEHGADVNAKDSYGHTPLRYASVSVAKVLRRYGGRR